MKATRFAALAFVLALSNSHRAAAQGLPTLPPGGYYINCPSGLYSTFYDYSLLPYAGHEWETSWRATSWSFPLPPLTWYEPVGTSDLVSTDGKAKWINAQVEVLCWIYNALDIIARHYDPYRFSGTVVACTGGGTGGGSDPFTTMNSGSDLTDSSYDPYASSYTGSTCAPGSPPTNGGSDSECHSEYIYIDESKDGGLTWHEIWEGWATVCG